MGYRSDVAIALSKEAAALLKARLEAATPDERYLLDNADLHDTDEESGDELWRWHYVKFYEEFREVAFINNFLQELDPSNYLFIRVGETYDDIEIRGDYWLNAFNLDVATSIVTN